MYSETDGGSAIESVNAVAPVTRVVQKIVAEALTLDACQLILSVVREDGLNAVDDA